MSVKDKRCQLHFTQLDLAELNWTQQDLIRFNWAQGGITCGAIDQPRKSSKAIHKRLIINFCDKNVGIARQK